jgi:tRNA-modifying protein YgfZ
MPTVHLDDRALISVEGADAESFLQNIITCDLSALGEGQAGPGALLTPQGKILFDFLVSRNGDDRFLLDSRAVLTDDFVRRLMLYRLRAKATIAKRDQADIAVSWGTDSSEAEAGQRLADRRFPAQAGVKRQYRLPLPPADAVVADWDQLRVEHGVAESGPDYATSDAFPHDVLLDENGGVGFAKGCYIGQEVVSRMRHRGTARRRVMIASGGGLVSSAEILADGRPIGTLGTVVGGTGLAIVRIDKVKAALDAGEPITSGGVAITLRIPPNAAYRFPEAATAEEA